MLTSTSESRNGKTPAPILKFRRAHALLRKDNDHQRNEQTECRGDLDEACVVSAAPVRHMFGNINGCAAILATQRQALQHSNDNENDCRKPSRRLVGGHQANGGR